MTQTASNQVAPAATPSAAAAGTTSSLIAPMAGNNSTADGSMSSPGSAAAPAARPGLQNTGPWIVGELYNVVPGGPLAPVPDQGEKWYAITKGRYVGVTNNAAVADGAVIGVSHALRVHYDSQTLALAAFNLALATVGLNLVQVV
ncbi:hypothetical protein B0H11DRAFT_2229615 [Mycena galericulata]|nr:hypothetical protein B0H11DRAFT_2229615 [Mycena galericulata]